MFILPVECCQLLGGHDCCKTSTYTRSMLSCLCLPNSNTHSFFLSPATASRCRSPYCTICTCHTTAFPAHSWRKIAASVSASKSSPSGPVDSCHSSTASISAAWAKASKSADEPSAGASSGRLLVLRRLAGG